MSTDLGKTSDDAARESPGGSLRSTDDLSLTVSQA